MKKNSSLDEHIKEQFSNYSPEVPPHIWENIVAGKDKRRPVAGWFSFFGKTGLMILAGLLISSLALLLYMNNRNSSETQDPGKKEFSDNQKRSSSQNNIGSTNTGSPANPTGTHERNEQAGDQVSAKNKTNITNGNVEVEENKPGKNKTSLPVITEIVSPPVMRNVETSLNKTIEEKGKTKVTINKVPATEDEGIASSGDDRTETGKGEWKIERLAP